MQNVDFIVQFIVNKPVPFFVKDCIRKLLKRRHLAKFNQNSDNWYSKEINTSVNDVIITYITQNYTATISHVSGKILSNLQISTIA